MFQSGDKAKVISNKCGACNSDAELIAAGDIVEVIDVRPWSEWGDFWKEFKEQHNLTDESKAVIIRVEGRKTYSDKEEFENAQYMCLEDLEIIERKIRFREFL